MEWPSHNVTFLGLPVHFNSNLQHGDGIQPLVFLTGHACLRRVSLVFLLEKGCSKAFQDMISISCLTPMSPVMKFTIRTLLVGRACGLREYHYDSVWSNRLKRSEIWSECRVAGPAGAAFLCCSCHRSLHLFAVQAGSDSEDQPPLTDSGQLSQKQKPMFRLQSRIYLHQLINRSKDILCVGISFFIVFFGNIGQKDFLSHMFMFENCWAGSCKPWISLLQVLCLWPSSFRCARRYCYLFAAMYIRMDVGLCRRITRHGTTSTLAHSAGSSCDLQYLVPWGVLRWDRWAPPNGTRWWSVLLLGVLDVKFWKHQRSKAIWSFYCMFLHVLVSVWQQLSIYCTGGILVERNWHNPQEEVLEWISV